MWASLEGFVREKVAQGEYESASEVMREAVRLLKRRDELWKREVQGKIAAGLDSLKSGHTVLAEEVWAKLEKTVVSSAARLQN